MPATSTSRPGTERHPGQRTGYSSEYLASVFDKTEAIAKQMDALGFDTLWLAEHHFQHEGYECIPNDLMLAVHLAHVTKNLKIGCAFNIAPMWHPLRLAEDFATADILTGGRTIFGVGRGYHTREVETFGAPMLNQEAIRELLRISRDYFQGVQRGIVFAPGQALHLAAARPLPRL
jgi:alkanesulfonate monooxygenase SsuD/methylene tetrahydromethanopterin reductase-like flavin-dependent oxidoreductase (luciferase family)